jgi:hypothetical protein
MRIGEFGLARGFRVAGSAYHRHHGQPQRLAARELEQIGDQFARRLRMDLPVEQIDNELLALGDEAAPQPACPKTLRSCALTCGKSCLRTGRYKRQCDMRAHGFCCALSMLGSI